MSELMELEDTETAQRIEDAGMNLIMGNMQRRHEEANALPNTLRDFENKQERHDAQRTAELPNMEDMLGNPPKSFERTRHTDGVTRTFYPLPPKLSALSTLMAGVQAVGYGELGESLLIMQLAATYLYTDGEEAGMKRPATVEEIEDFIDLADLELLKQMNQKYLNVVMGDKTSPNE